MLLVIQNGRCVHFHLTHGIDKFNQFSNKAWDHSKTRTITYIFAKSFPTLKISPNSPSSITADIISKTANDSIKT